MCPWADVLYAMDRQWWDRYRSEVDEVFGGARVAPSQGIRGATFERITKTGNSGAGALVLAAHWDAKRIVMLGYDCQKTDGRAHWHPDHPTEAFGTYIRGLGNAGSLPKWPQQFSDTARLLRGVEVINATRETALTMFHRMHLEDALA